MEQDPTRICELLVGLGDVDVVGVVDEPSGPLVVHVRTRHRPVCSGCGGLVRSKDISAVRLVDFAGVRPSGAVGVAQASLVLPGHRLFERVRSPRSPRRSHRFVRR